MSNTEDDMAIAVIGMSCRFPGAKNIDAFWDNLRNGVESVEVLSDEDLIANGIKPEQFNAENYVRNAPTLEDIEKFDAGFFGFSPGEAKILDPQRRLFLMCGWEVFEDAGYNPYSIEDPVAVYGSAGVTQYYNNQLCGNEEIYKVAGEQQILISNDKDHLPTHLSYKLNLKGPSVNVNTACSSSLVAVHLARMSLLLGECDMAVAGGASVMVPNKAGYMYVDDSILAKDGHCRAFDENATGTLWGSGCGVVLLKRLSDAVRDNDNIRAIIRGSAINNDGNDKVGYTAPSVKGQSEVVIQALASADLEPKDISYIEAHGTGTKLGDPIEIAALVNVFDEFDQVDSQCKIGSVKPNIGHLGAAAGIASFIKSVLALEHSQIPPSINFDTPNSKIKFEETPFEVNSKLSDWSNPVRRLGISSLAVGGTNCHIVMEQAAAREIQSHNSGTEGSMALYLSARTKSVLAEMASNLANYCLKTEDVRIENIAYTLQTGRNTFQQKAVIFVKDIGDAIVKLDAIAAGETEQYCNAETIENYEFPTDIVNASIESVRSWINGDIDKIESPAFVFGNKISLPTYPFDLQSYWVEFERSNNRDSTDYKLNNKTGTPSEWFYEQSWQRKTLRPLKNEEKVENAKWLIFANSTNFSKQLVQQLPSTQDNIITVFQGDKFEKISDTKYKLNPDDFDDYSKLVTSLKDTFELPSRVVHLWGAEAKSREPSKVNVDGFRAIQKKCYYSVLNFVQALNHIKSNSELSIKVLTTDMHDVTGLEKVRPEKASIIGLLKVLQQEFQNITCQSLDFSIPMKSSKEEESLLSNVVAEMLTDDTDLIVAYRNDRRWVQSYERVIISPEMSAANPIKEAGTYLVYDGLVGIGLEVSKHLLTEYKAQVLILGDVSMPAMEQWDTWLETHDPKEDVSVKIGGCKELIELGGVFVSPMPEDNNVEQLTKIVKEAESVYGSINGVIHCSGGSANGHVRAVNKASFALTERDFITVPYALMALDEVFENHALDFRLVMSSLGSILGGILFVSYGSSNCLAASFAEYSNRNKDYQWNVQCWDSWDIEWKIVDYKNTTLHDNITDRLRNIALTVDEGLDCFHRSLAYASKNHITISSTDLQARIDKWVNKQTMEGFKTDTTKPKKRHPRPNIDTHFSAPKEGLEQQLAKSFENLLDIDVVGRSDNFFELGGHSLLATQLITELRTVLNTDMAISDILENPSVEQLARVISASESVEEEFAEEA